METDILSLVWNTLQSEIRDMKSKSGILSARSERAETAGGFVAIPFAALPYAVDGAGDGDTFKVTNACKVGESSGAGTGTLCYFDPATNTWRRVGDDTAVVI